ncbi:ATP-binding cassette domain-containing protein [Reichenbachiella sp. MALMAid0571]|uniref:ABC transporter ATP-binding protein n=1 Tax=Reichenbachiella sp. MALMAid0571 TaxID=3143939 RepID=UPI0032DE7D77
MNYKETDIETATQENADGWQVPAVEIIDLKKSFGNNHVLKGFNLSIKQGENVAVLGKSGSGKSVLIKCIVGLIKPDSGQIKVFGRDVVNLNRQELDEVRSKIGFLFQSNALYDSLTVRENLEFPMRRLRIKKTKAEVDQMVHEALTSVGLPDVQELMPASLSGGMKKRVGVARTLILQPDIILYDEPTSGLDPITSREIANLMNDVHRKYKTSSIIISHDMSCIKRTAQRIVLLNDGIDYLHGNYEELKNSTDEIVNSFFL